MLETCCFSLFRTREFEGHFDRASMFAYQERVNKVISGEKMGSDIPSRFLRRLQKTAGFDTMAVVGKAVIRQAFIRQMPQYALNSHPAGQCVTGKLSCSSG